MSEKNEGVVSRIFSEIFEEPIVDLDQIRPCEQLLLLTMGLGRAIEQLEPSEQGVFSYMLGLADDNAHSVSEVATLMGIDVQAVDTHYAEGLRKVRAHPEVQRMRLIVRRAAVT